MGLDDLDVLEARRSTRAASAKPHDLIQPEPPGRPSEPGAATRSPPGRFVKNMPVEGERTIRRAYEAFAKRDLETLKRLADDSIEVATVTGVMAGRTEPYRGHAGLAEYMRDLAGTWRRIELQPQQFQQIEPGKVLVFGRARVWHEHGFLDASNAWLWSLAGGKVLRVQVLADPGEARRAFSEGD